VEAAVNYLGQEGSFGPEELKKLERAVDLAWVVLRERHQEPEMVLKGRIRQAVLRLATDGGDPGDPGRLADKVISELSE
jgi:hypothetical protein